MAEEEDSALEGFDDIDSLLDDDAGGGEDAGFGDELDSLIGEEDIGGDDAGLGGDEGDEGGGDSELDSFFEALSTIDDLEVAQDDSPPAEEPAEAPAPEPDDFAPVEAAAPVAAAVAAAPAAALPPKEKKERPGLKRAIRYLILLLVLGGSGYFDYTMLFPQLDLPWPVTKDILEEEQQPQMAQLQAPPPQPPPALQAPPALQPPAPVAMRPAPLPVAMQPAPVAAPQPAAPPPPPGKGYGVQVATCFFNSCVKGYQSLLNRNRRDHSITERRTRNESLEILSSTAFSSRETAEELAGRINHEHRLEGQAYVARYGDAFKISMGTFPDLQRANVVKDSLNQRLGGEVNFASRLKSSSYSLRRIVTGRFATRAEARREALALRKLDRRFRDAFVVRN